jgi:signal transduction histidine kinase
MYAIGAALSPTLSIVLVILGLFVVGGLLYAYLVTRAKLELQRDQVAAIREELQERTFALKRVQREASELKQAPRGELLSMLQLAHELRSPLASIQSALDMLLQGYAKRNVELQDEMSCSAWPQKNASERAGGR